MEHWAVAFDFSYCTFVSVFHSLVSRRLVAVLIVLCKFCFTMPKEKQSVSSRLKNYLRELGENTFAIDASVLLCKFCDIKINHEKRFNITQHLKTEKHIKAVNRAENQVEKNRQQLVTNTTKKSSFSKDLCFALLSANIPLHKLSNQSFRRL